MASETSSKLNRLQQLLPEGMVVDAAWLEANGYSHPLRQKYVANGWLEILARSVYRRPAAKLVGTERDGGDVEWRLVVLSLQNLMRVGVSVGGRTALDLQGFAHYLPAKGPREVHLYASERLPGWLDKLPASGRFVVHKQNRLFDHGGRGLSHVGVKVKAGGANDSLSGASFAQMPWGHWNWPLTLSTPERAILELVDELPEHESFEQVDALMNGLATLSPRRLQVLLEACQSIKVKRLFLFLAERHRHAWFKRLDVTRIDLGSGKRALVESGKYDSKYKITVPQFLMDRTDGL